PFMYYYSWYSRDFHSFPTRRSSDLVCVSSNLVCVAPRANPMPIREAQSRSCWEFSFADVEQAPCRRTHCNRVDSPVFSDGQSDRFRSIFRSFSGEKRTDVVNRRGISRRQRGGTATSVTSAPRCAPVAVVALTLLVA